MLVGTAATTFASPPPSGGAAAVWDGTAPPGPLGAVESDATLSLAVDGAQEIYFASVANGVDFGLGAASTSITVQNIDEDDAYAFFWVGGAWDLSLTSYLGAGASKTYSAAYLGIGAGEDVPVIVALYNTLTSNLADGAFGAGVAKQAVAGANLPYTSDVDTSVSGYNAVSGREVGYWDVLYFPIVQTNCGPGGCWDTNLIVANVGDDDNAAVTIAFFPADDGSGSLQTGFQIQRLLNVGDSWSVNLSTLVPDGWVGSARVYSDDAVVAIANRFKAGTDMWVTNTASNAQSEHNWQDPEAGDLEGLGYVLYAPDVRTDWNGWNMGINVANTVAFDNDVHIQYAGIGGNAPSGLSQRLAADGMTYFYNASDPSEDNCAQPATQVPTCDFIGGALILSQEPVTAVVDGVKYFGNDSNVGQAFSYSATGNAYEEQFAPLIQKGQASTGMGATSGINFMNPNPGSTTVQVEWVNPSGYSGSNYLPSVVWVPGFATGFVYTMNAHNLPNGFLGAAWVESSDEPIVSTTANVDYQVSGDGTAIWNLYNPCGFFRQYGGVGTDGTTDDQGNIGSCLVINNPYDVLVYSVTMTVTVDTDRDATNGGDVDNVIANGMSFTVDGTSDYDHHFNATSTAVACSGSPVVCVPAEADAIAGDYDLTINGIPAGYEIRGVGVAPWTNATATTIDVDGPEEFNVVLQPKAATLDVTVQLDGTTVGNNVAVSLTLNATTVTTGQGGDCVGGTTLVPGSTNALGVASFSNLNPGIYCVKVDPNGDTSAVVGTVQVNPGAAATLTLNDVTQMGSLVVTVQANSVAAAGAVVTVREWVTGEVSGQGGYCSGAAVTSGTTDPSGNVTFNLAWGKYCLMANPYEDNVGTPSAFVAVVNIPADPAATMNDTVQ